ncbi:15664_t:CDS:10 [Entrophospora sp. SA101]|nr:22286_t:CDS:10 [Entrophospora sp. SA101]CAJ0905693.1 15664_t:CDS:10 [Entrophospora sp. SA101]
MTHKEKAQSILNNWKVCLQEILRMKTEKKKKGEEEWTKNVKEYNKMQDLINDCNILMAEQHNKVIKTAIVQDQIVSVFASISKSYSLCVVFGIEVGPSIAPIEFRSENMTSVLAYPTKDSPMDIWLLPSGKSVAEVTCGPSTLHKPHPSYIGIILGSRIQWPKWIENEDWIYLQESIEYPKDPLGSDMEKLFNNLLETDSLTEYLECLHNTKFDIKNKQMLFATNILQWFADVVFNPSSAFHSPCEQKSILGSLLVHPVLKYISNTCDHNPEDNKPLGLKIDGVFQTVNDNPLEIGMIELSGRYNTHDFPQYLKDHVHGCWGQHDLLNNIAMMLLYGNYKNMRHLRTWFFHTHGKDVQIWGMDLPVKKIYCMFLLGTFQLPISWESHHELLCALLILWNFGRGLNDSVNVLEELKKTHHRNSLLHSQASALKRYIRHIKHSLKNPLAKSM